MRALVWDGPGSLVLREVPRPVAAAGEVVVAVGAAGVCGSDIAGYTGAMGNRAPGHVMGHELAGTVVRGVEHLVGLRVVVDPVVGCWRCPACAAGRPSRCPELTLVGVHRPGGFAEEVAVPARNVVVVPAGVPFASASLAEPLAQARHDVGIAQSVLGVDARGTAVVIGAGPIGALIAWVAARRGFRSVVVIDPDPGRREAAAALCGGVASPAAVDEHIGADVVFEAVGTEQTRRDALRLVRRGGAVVLVGLHDDETPLPWRLAIRKEVVLCGANCMDPGDVTQAVRWLSAGQPALTPEVLPLEEGPELFAALAAGRAGGLKWTLSPGG